MPPPPLPPPDFKGLGTEYMNESVYFVNARWCIDTSFAVHNTGRHDYNNISGGYFDIPN